MKYKFIDIFFGFYKMFISPSLLLLFGKGCIYYPTCSQYAKESLEKYGMIKGFRLTIKRILKCNRANVPMFDPVP